MANLKKIKLNQNAMYIGMVMKDAELRQTSGGNDTCNINIGIDTQEKGEDGKSIFEFISVQLWGSAAVYYSNLKKLDMIELKGIVTEDKWTTQDGEERITYKLTSGLISPLPSHIAFRIQRKIEKQSQAYKPQAQPQVAIPSPKADDKFAEVQDISDDFPFA